MIGENGFPETPDWAQPPRTIEPKPKPKVPVTILANAELDGYGDN